MDAIKDILERGAFFTVADKDLDGPSRRRMFQNLEWAHLVLSWVFVLIHFLIYEYCNGLRCPKNW